MPQFNDASRTIAEKFAAEPPGILLETLARGAEAGFASILCELDTSVLRSLKSLALLWKDLAERFQAGVKAIEGSENALVEFSRCAHSPFFLSTRTVDQILDGLAYSGSRGAVNTLRAISNGLNEISLLACSLACFGTADFVERASRKCIEGVHYDEESSEHLVYQSPHFNNALLSLLTSTAYDTSDRTRLESLRPDQLVFRLREQEKVAPLLSAKERYVMDEVLGAESIRSGASIVVVPRQEAELLYDRLARAFLRKGHAPRIDLVLGSNVGQPLAIDAVPQLIIADIASLSALRLDHVRKVLIWSPLFIDDGKLMAIAGRSFQEGASAHPGARIETLMAPSGEFALELSAYTLAMEGISRGLKSPMFERPSLQEQSITVSRSEMANLIIPVPRPDPVGIPTSRRKKRKRVEIDIAERVLFSDLPPLPPAPITEPQQRLVPLPSINPKTLPQTLEDLNRRLGISLIKPSLAVREDQMHPFFQMIEAKSFEYILRAPTGFGKTPFASVVMATLLGDSPLSPIVRNGRPLIYMVPYVDLTVQTRDEVLNFLNLQPDEIGILEGKTKRSDREKVLWNPKAKIIIALPETLLRTLGYEPERSDVDPIRRFAHILSDEFHVAEGRHSVARAIARATRAGVPTFAFSGTPVRDEEDVMEKRALGCFRGILVPKTLPPLKQYQRLDAYLETGEKTLVQDLVTLSYAPYIRARERILNAQIAIAEIKGNETPRLFPEWQTVTKRANIKSFGGPSHEWIERSKSVLGSLRKEIQKHGEKGSDSEFERQRAGIARGLTSQASIEVGRIRSLSHRIHLLEACGRYPFLADFASTWIQGRLLPNSVHRFPPVQDYFQDPDYRGIVRVAARETPFEALLNCSSLPEALESAFNLRPDQIPDKPSDQVTLFHDRALWSMVKNPELDHAKERNLYRRITELSEFNRLKGMILFAEPRDYALFLALRIEHRFSNLPCHTAYVTGDEKKIRKEGFSFAALKYYEEVEADPKELHSRRKFGTVEEIKSAFEGKSPEINLPIIVATSRLSTGVNIPAADEAHLLTVDGNAIKMLQQIGRVGRPKQGDFYGSVGQCFFHGTSNSREKYLVDSTLNRYKWIRDNPEESVSWQTDSTKADEMDSFKKKR